MARSGKLTHLFYPDRIFLYATCEGDSPKIDSSIDPLSGFVLYSAKIKSENKDDLVGFLKEIKKQFGIRISKSC